MVLNDDGGGGGEGGGAFANHMWSEPRKLTEISLIWYCPLHWQAVGFFPSGNPRMKTGSFCMQSMCWATELLPFPIGLY